MTKFRALPLDTNPDTKSFATFSFSRTVERVCFFVFVCGMMAYVLLTSNKCFRIDFSNDVLFRSSCSAPTAVVAQGLSPLSPPLQSTPRPLPTRPPLRCVRLINAVSYHSEVLIALHSYILQSGWHVCAHHQIRSEFGYTEWFTPPNTTYMREQELWSEYQSKETKITLRGGDRGVVMSSRSAPREIGDVSPRDAIDFSPLILTTAHSKTPPWVVVPRAISIVHRFDTFPLEIALRGNWTLAFLGQRIKQTWDTVLASAIASGVTTMPRQAVQAMNQPMNVLSFLAVWQASTSLSTNPYIHIVKPTDNAESSGLPGMLQWSDIARILASENAQAELGNAPLVPLRWEDVLEWRYLVVQGKLDPERRDYEALFEWLASSRRVTADPRFKLVLLGRIFPDIRNVFLQLVIEHSLQDKVIIIPSCRHTQYAAMLDHSRGLFPARKLSDMTYLNEASSSSIPTAVSMGIPIISDFGVRFMYGDDVAGAVVEYDHPNIRALSCEEEMGEDGVHGYGGDATSSFCSSAYINLRPVRDTDATLHQLRTFDEAVTWLINMSQSEFDSLRRRVIDLRDRIFDRNTKMIANAIHQAYYDLVADAEKEDQI